MPVINHGHLITYIILTILSFSACSDGTSNQSENGDTDIAESDGDSIPDGDRSNDDGDLDETMPECHIDTDCEDSEVCHEGQCREPVYPAVSEFATIRANYELNSENLLVNGRTITPAGEAVFVGVQPNRLALTPDGNFAVVNEATWGTRGGKANRGNYALRVVDLSSMEVVDTQSPPTNAVWHGLHLQAGSPLTVWTTGGKDNRIHEFELSTEGHLLFRRSISIDGCYTTDILLDAAGQTAYVTCLKSSTLALSGSVQKVDLQSETILAKTSLAGAFYLGLSPDESDLWVTSIATEVRPAEGDTVTIFDATDLGFKQSVHVGLGAEGIQIVSERNEVFVACNRSDDIYVLDLQSYAIKESLSLHEDTAPLKGMYPVRLWVDSDSHRLYVAASHENALAVIDLATKKTLGFIPTGWYPNDLALTPDGTSLIVSNGRGTGDGPADYPGPGVAGPGRNLRGTISKISLPNDSELVDYTEQVALNNNRQAQFFDFSNGNDTPLPSPDADPIPSEKIKHIFFILKENFSYDCAYGDFERGVGNPDYLLWGEDILPNQRKLAREFTLFDNFYCESDSSLDGHQWAAAGIETDFNEKYNWHASDFGTIACSLTPGTAPESDYILPHLIKQGIDAFGFGGIENFGAESLTVYAENLMPGYEWNTVPDVTDVSRAELFQEEFARRLEEGTIPSYSWIFLGNNHAFGLTVGEPIPEYWVAENDLAVGMVIDTIARSSIWENSLIFITEDDAQSGNDHIDKHRCPALAVGPYVKRAYLSSVLYTINNFHKTAELLLGSGPMHRLDNRAIGMYDIFTARPDLTPYEGVLDEVPRTIYEGPENSLTRMSARMDWSAIDRNPDANELYWRYRKGSEPPPASVYYRYRELEEEDEY